MDDNATMTENLPPPPAAAPPQPRKSRFSFTLLLLGLAFLAGIAATIWGPETVRSWWSGHGGRDSTGQSALLPPGLPDDKALPPQGTASVNAAQLNSLESRVTGLDMRLQALNVQAMTASSYASRAESLMVAFAARRALDNGSALGYLESELRARFGDAQPKAVATIITAAQEPVTLADLQAGLYAAMPRLMDSASEQGWWRSTLHELANLVVIRKANAPTRVPQTALENARALLMAGRTEAALEQIELLPGHERVDGWIQMARRYNEARRALDVIETAAILEPRVQPAPVPSQSVPVAPQPQIFVPMQTPAAPTQPLSAGSSTNMPTAGAGVQGQTRP